MAQYDNTNRGTLGKNRQPKNDKSPHFTGKVDIRGTVYWLAGWRQEDFMSDDHYISLSLTGKDDASLTGSGRLENNRDKIGNRPDMVGRVIVEGAEYEISAWTKTHDNGKFLSIQVRAASVRRPQDDKQFGTAYGDSHEDGTRPKYNEPPMDFDDDIPF